MQHVFEVKWQIFNMEEIFSSVFILLCLWRNSLKKLYIKIHFGVQEWGYIMDNKHDVKQEKLRASGQIKKKKKLDKINQHLLAADVDMAYKVDLTYIFTKSIIKFIFLLWQLDWFCLIDSLDHGTFCPLGDLMALIQALAGRQAVHTKLVQVFKTLKCF